jgi:hypothetical protein
LTISISGTVVDNTAYGAVLDNEASENITITVTSSEALQAPPTVMVIRPSAITDVVTMTQVGTENKWQGTYLVRENGSHTINASGQDLAGNPGAASLGFEGRVIVKSFNIPLATGWNLISLPLIPDNTAVGAILDNIRDNVVRVWTYDVAKGWTWARYDAGLGMWVGDLTTGVDGNPRMETGYGYWIYMRGESTLVPRGVVLRDPTYVPPTYYMRAGWNLLGFHSVAARLVEDALTNISGKYGSVWRYRIGIWERYPGDFTTLDPGRGYWIYMKSAGTLAP